MARKSRATIRRERLREVSSCPDDIFDILTPDEALIELLSRAECGDRGALNELISRIYSFLDSPEKLEEARTRRNASLIYWCKRAAECGDGDLALAAVKLCLAVGYGFEAAEEAISVITDDGVSRRLTLAVSASRVITAVTDGEDPMPALSSLDRIVYADLWAFALAARRGRQGFYSTLIEACKSLGIQPVLSLPCFGESEARLPRLEDSEISVMLSAIAAISEKYFYPAWSDFWLICMYELCREYRGGDCRELAPLAARIVGRRSFSRKRSLHALAWISYMLDGDIGEEASILRERAAKLEALARFEGYLTGALTPEALAALREEAIYTSAAEEQRAREREAIFGNKIRHERNRYSLSASLIGHSKRGSRHYWETVISFPLDGGEELLPEIDTLRVDRAYNVISRGGVTLPRDNTSSQLALSSEITLRGVRSPLSVDLILDIAYISAGKCGACEIKVKSHEFIDGYAVLRCQVYLY